MEKAGKVDENTGTSSRFSKNASKKTMTVRQLSKYFNSKKSVSKLNSSLSNGRLTRPDKKTGLYIKKAVIDSGNPRYAASKHSSFLGGLTTG